MSEPSLIPISGTPDMTEQQAERLAATVLEQTPEDPFHIDVGDTFPLVAESFRRMGCHVERDEFRPTLLRISRPPPQGFVQQGE